MQKQGSQEPSKSIQEIRQVEPTRSACLASRFHRVIEQDEEYHLHLDIYY